MAKEKIPKNPIPSDYIMERVNNSQHSSQSNFCLHDDKTHHANNVLKSKDNTTSHHKSIKSENTERIPTLAKYSDMNNTDDEFEYKGNI
ncbi:hypothetical protein [Clostridium saccharobutylicum]|uniref:Uncharacterized protein n=1 Tax=Clostridium saccharobutylicum TaxID=169679 RepID=A0A1S8N3C7_CLOSA|nr:hypothetical protein [Clostridium saccharobutylicum]OOM10999.1 hypothetical protein CLOSAC_25270 [Clostridium saccharobutylicum]